MGLGRAADHRQRISAQADQRNAQILERRVVLQVADLLDVGGSAADPAEVQQHRLPAGE
jgi:hypothetical protein